jgi:splicing factor 3A subunit 3
MLILEEQRYIHEDLERLEQGIADRTRDEPKHVSNPRLLGHLEEED